MSFIRWQDKFSTGVATFDEQHQGLFGLINELYEQVIACEDLEEEKQITQKVLGKLIAYTKDHFAAEEAFMQNGSFPGLAAHRLEHERFCARVEELVREYRKSPGGLSNDVLIFMRDWITLHVTETDLQYAVFFAQKGVD